jgi:hypothetical protein
MKKGEKMTIFNLERVKNILNQSEAWKRRTGGSLGRLEAEKLINALASSIEEIERIEGMSKNKSKEL